MLLLQCTIITTNNWFSSLRYLIALCWWNLVFHSSYLVELLGLEVMEVRTKGVKGHVDWDREWRGSPETWSR